MSEENSPPFVEFEIRPMEDRQASIAAGYYVAKDVDFIMITPRGSAGKLRIEEPYSKWLTKTKGSQFRNEMRSGDASTPMQSARFPDVWLEKIEAMYGHWKKGQVLPETGFPLMQWGVPSPAQRKRLIDLHILTVEQLAEATEEAMENFGMGGRNLRQRAKDFLKANNSDAAKVAAEMEDLRTKNTELQAKLENVLSKIEAANATKPTANSPSVRA